MGGLHPLNRVVREGLTETVTFELREKVTQIWRKNTAGSGNSRCKGPGAGAYMFEAQQGG